MEQDEIISKIDEAVKKIREFEEEKENAYREKTEAELKYIRTNHELRIANIELNKFMALTRKFRRTYPRPSDEWKKRIIEEVGKCEECGSTNIEDLTIHHKTPLGMGGNNERSNLQVLCRECHEKIHPLPPAR